MVQLRGIPQEKRHANASLRQTRPGGQPIRYLAIIELAEDGSYSAYVPDLPVCVAVGQDSPEGAKRLITAAIETHIHGMIEDGLPVPEPSSRAEYVQAVA